MYLLFSDREGTLFNNSLNAVFASKTVVRILGKIFVIVMSNKSGNLYLVRIEVV